MNIHAVAVTLLPPSLALSRFVRLGYRTIIVEFNPHSGGFGVCKNVYKEVKKVQNHNFISIPILLKTTLAGT